jgi:hypothetical protein
MTLTIREVAVRAVNVPLDPPLPLDNDAGLPVLRLPVQGGENWWRLNGMGRTLATGAADPCLPMSSHIFIEASAHLLDTWTSPVPCRASHWP